MSDFADDPDAYDSQQLDSQFAGAGEDEAHYFDGDVEDQEQPYDPDGGYDSYQNDGSSSFNQYSDETADGGQVGDFDENGYNGPYLRWP